MFSWLTITTTHSTGINWGQALGTGIPIILGIAGILAACSKFVKNAVQSGLETFAATLNVKFHDIEDEIDHHNRRLDRIDRNTKTDSN